MIDQIGGQMSGQDSDMLKIVRGSLVTAEARLFDHVSTTFRWIMATLFAANGGSIIALLGSPTHANELALGLFASGLALSILMGMLSTIWAYRTIFSLEAARIAIDLSLITRIINEDSLTKLVERQRLTWKTWVPSYVGGGSFVCLMVGMLVIACRL